LQIDRKLAWGRGAMKDLDVLNRALDGGDLGAAERRARGRELSAAGTQRRKLDPVELACVAAHGAIAFGAYGFDDRLRLHQRERLHALRRARERGAAVTRIELLPLVDANRS